MARRVGHTLKRNADALLEPTKACLEAAYLLGRRRRRDTLAMFDDLFPWLGTGFRISEFNSYLRRFEGSVVYSTHPNFGGEMRRYRRQYPEYAKRIFRFRSERRFQCRLAYIVFLHNAVRFLPVIDEFSLPFVLELYPGGQFRLDDPFSDESLRRVCSSPFLRKIIVTQRVTMRYLADKQFCPETMLLYVYGGVIQLPAVTPERRVFGTHKDTFDICFTAYRQMPLGLDKGYDLFIEAAKRLSGLDARLRFHVVGDFDADDIDCSSLGGKITFYGPRTTDFFPSYYQDKDLIVSPNRPFALASGAFDGIPTGAVVEAGACGVAMFCTDQLALTDGIFESGKDIVLVDGDVDSICEQVMTYVRRPDALYEIGRHGKRTIDETFSSERQLSPRQALLSSILQTTA